MSKKIMIIIGFILLMTVTSASAVIIDNWKTIDPETGNYTEEKLYFLTGRLSDYPGNYGLLPFTVNDVENEQQIIFDLKMWNNPYIGWMEHPEPIDFSAVVSVDGGVWQNLPLDFIVGERLINGQYDWEWYRVNYTIPDGARTVAMRFDSSFHLSPLEEEDKVYMYFQTPLNENPITGNVVAEYDNKEYSATGKIAVMNIFDYKQYARVVDREVIVDKKEPDSFVDYITRTHENVVDYGNNTKLGGLLFASFFYAIILIGAFVVGRLLHLIIYYNLKKRGR